MHAYTAMPLVATLRLFLANIEILPNARAANSVQPAIDCLYHISCTTFPVAASLLITWRRRLAHVTTPAVLTLTSFVVVSSYMRFTVIPKQYEGSGS
jgi:hypothetical protein